jgi:diguanylate cyclase (GGDEF)-like protein
MESLLAASTEIIWVFDDSGPIVASLPARQLIGLAHDDPIGNLRLHEILPNWAAVRFIDEGMSRVESGEAWSASLAMRDGNIERAAMVTLAHRHEDSRRRGRLWTLHGRWLEVAPAGEALRDELTGLLSEAMFTEYLNQSIARSERSGTPVSIVILELDHFDSVTDHLGSQMTDRLLQTTAECLSSNLRAGDTLARLAGGRFAVGRETMPDIRDAARFGERLRSTLDQPLIVDGVEWYLCASGGVALTRPGMTTVEGLLRNADAALHQAKLSGRGRSVVFGATLGSDSASTPHRTPRWNPRPPQPPHRNGGSSTER